MPSSPASLIRKTWQNTKSVTLKIDTIQAIAPDYDVIVFDQWGVLHDGTSPYVGAVAAVEDLGVSAAVLSNSGKRSKPNEHRITNMGFSSAAFDLVMTSGEALWRDISVGKISAKRFFAVQGAPGDAAIWADGLDIELVDNPANADAILLMGLPDGAVLRDWQGALKQWLALGLPIYCSNPDRQSPRSNGLVISPGALAFAYKEIGGSVSFYGKPHLPIFRALEGTIGAGRYVMVGDSMEHDIAGAHAAGWDGLLIQSGLYATRFAGADEAMVLKDIASEKSCAPPKFTMDHLQ